MFEDLGSIRRGKLRYLKSYRCKTDICARMSYGVRNVRCKTQKEADNFESFSPYLKLINMLWIYYRTDFIRMIHFL